MNPLLGMQGETFCQILNSMDFMVTAYNNIILMGRDPQPIDLSEKSDPFDLFAALTHCIDVLALGWFLGN